MNPLQIDISFMVMLIVALHPDIIIYSKYYFYIKNWRDGKENIFNEMGMRQQVINNGSINLAFFLTNNSGIWKWHSI